MFTILDYSSALEYSIIRRYTNIVYYYYYYFVYIIIIRVQVCGNKYGKLVLKYGNGTSVFSK